MEKTDTWQALWEMLKAQPGDDPTTVEVSLDGMRRVADALSNNGWRDISTAPKTSRAILVHVPDVQCTYAVTWHVPYGEPHDAGRWHIFGGGSREFLRDERITHWQPLPQPPGGSE